MGGCLHFPAGGARSMADRQQLRKKPRSASDGLNVRGSRRDARSCRLQAGRAAAKRVSVAASRSLEGVSCGAATTARGSAELARAARAGQASMSPAGERASWRVARQEAEVEPHLGATRAPGERPSWVAWARVSDGGAGLHAVYCRETNSGVWPREDRRTPDGGRHSLLAGQPRTRGPASVVAQPVRGADCTGAAIGVRPTRAPKQRRVRGVLRPVQAPRRRLPSLWCCCVAAKRGWTQGQESGRRELQRRRSASGRVKRSFVGRWTCLQKSEWSSAGR